MREVSILCEDAQKLIAALEEELAADYAPEHRHGVEFESFHREGGVFVIAYESEMPIGCGALRPWTDSQIELKRMYVASDYRGRGVARAVLRFLENKARSLGFSKLLLETGDQQFAAIALYEGSGYDRTEPYGEYIDSPRSVCFAKQLDR